MNTVDRQTTPKRSRFPIGIIIEYPGMQAKTLEHKPAEVIAVIAGGRTEDDAARESRIRSGADAEQFLWTGFSVNLYADEAESYYFNLKGENPSIFVISRTEDDQRIRPFLVTLSYDEAASHLEVDDTVTALPIPPEIYRWIEAFVLEHYIPQKKKKRKLDDWKQPTGANK